MRSGQNPNIDDDTRARARRFVEDAGMLKPAVTANPLAKKTPIVTKKMLADSGFDNLRDYLNAQRGLTRRKDKTDPTAGEAIDRAAQEAADAIDPGDPRTRELNKTRGSQAENYSRNTRTGAPVRPENYSLMKRGGKVKGYAKGGSVSKRADGIAIKGKTKGRFV